MGPWARAPRAFLLGVGVLALVAVALALVSQHQFGMLPCPWCTLQRLIFLLIAAVALLGALLPTEFWRRGLAGLGALLAASGVAAALWQHLVAASTESCDLTFADRLLLKLGLVDLMPSVFAPMASCAEANVPLLGLPYAYWSLGVFAVCGTLCAAVAWDSGLAARERRARRGHRPSLFR